MENKLGYTLILLFLSFQSRGFAAEFIPIGVRVEYGEKESFFDFMNGEKGIQVEFSSNQDSPRVTRLSQKNYKKFVVEVSQFGPPRETIRTCPRSYMTVTMGQTPSVQKWSACLGSRSVLGRKLSTFLKELSLMF